MSVFLDVRGLEVRFGDTFRVGPASFCMGPGVLHVAGPNGSGKTTLLRALAGELLPHEGKVIVNGLAVHESAGARREIALVPSIPELPGFLSVSEAYQFTASLRRRSKWSGLALCEALDLDPALPLANASAGQRRKAELICGLAGDPLVLLLDETFSHLDDHAVARLREWVVKWSESRLVVLTHHGSPPVSASAVLHVDRERVTLTEC